MQFLQGFVFIGGLMVWQPSATQISLPEQKLTPAPARTGFVAVEWGGQQIIK